MPAGDLAPCLEVGLVPISEKIPDFARQCKFCKTSREERKRKREKRRGDSPKSNSIMRAISLIRYCHVILFIPHK